MKLIKILVVIGIFIVITSFVLGSSNVYFFFDTSQNKTITQDKGIIKASSIVFEVDTDKIFDSCRYSTNNKPFNSMEGFFDEEYGKIHKKIFTDLDDGLYRYYVRCSPNSSDNSVLEAIFSINKPISATISLSKEEPLKSGKYEITLVTSKLPSSEPSLSYSFDGVTYHPIPLFGSGKNWKGYLIISEKTGDAIISFKFSAKDLQGNSGDKIIGQSVFVIDTNPPKAISTISSESYEGQIKLKWYYDDEEIEEFNIYRSERSGVDYINYFDSTNKNYFTDNSVEKGKTYYYRVAPVDKAGNIGALSREIKATALLENTTQTQTGLPPELIGKVDNFIVEIDSLINNIVLAKSNINAKDEESRIFKELKLDKKIENSLNELNALKRDVGNYKLQDLSEAELDNKLNSARTKLNIIKKKTPEDLTIKGQKESKNTIETNVLRSALLDYNQSFSENDLDNYISSSEKLIKSFKAKNKIYLLEILYTDGTTKDISFFESAVNSELAPNSSSVLMLNIPKDIAEEASEIKMLNPTYDVINPDPLFGFDIDTENIFYYIEKEIDKNLIEEITLIPIQKPQPEGFIFTGNSIFNVKNKNTLGSIILVIVVIGLIGYFIYIKKKSFSNEIPAIIEKINNIKKEVEKNNFDEAKKLYSSLKEDYKKLPKYIKKQVIEKINEINEVL